MKLETAKRLSDARDACVELREITADETLGGFLDNRIPKLAVWKLIEIVGEALRQAEHTDRTIATRLPNIREVVDTRNRIVHGYDSVSFRVLWEIVESEIPPLQGLLEDLLRDAPAIPGTYLPE
ncbi:MAG TPA: HepT-like ribonuclease domain-containing protein, partial [Thermomicrobiales bacterium]|nr:HepT-like ribonuclease domain-containing protein [Thermomicrobiales bacterium]